MFNYHDTENFYNNVAYFLTVTVGVFAITFGVLYVFDLVPTSLQSGDVQTVIDEEEGEDEDVVTTPQTVTLPDNISIPKIGLEAAVAKPQSPDLATLNDYLRYGAVYYPGSGSIEQGNIFVFGHSADIYRNVQNPALKVFNGFQKLIPGDPIVITADGSKYVYKVTSVQKVVDDDALVTFDTSTRRLTLSTCNTFGQKQDRIIVEAEFSHEI